MAHPWPTITLARAKRTDENRLDQKSSGTVSAGVRSSQDQVTPRQEPEVAEHAGQPGDGLALKSGKLGDEGKRG